MRQEQLWAPWRLAYVAGELTPQAEQEPQRSFLPGADPQCFICRGLAEPSDRDPVNLIVARGSRTVTLLNRFPYNNGHLLISPQRHVGQLEDLTVEEHTGCMLEVTRMVRLLRQVIKAEGFNVGLNLGRVAGAGLPGHLHWHIVPRWNGDTNFMPTLAGVKVIPQSLETLRDLLREASAELAQAAGNGSEQAQDG